MRRVLAGVLAMLAMFGLTAACKRGGVPASGSPTTKPRLVVLVVIDQWPSWIFQQQKKLFTGGIRRLLEDGAIVDAAEIPYANTFTAPGHATLGTGAVPRETGVVGNYWYRRAEGRSRPAEYDPEALPMPVGPALGGVELSPADGASGKGLKVEGVADVLRTATKGAGKSVSIALKPRAACLMAGRQPDIAVWYEPGAGGMTTSAAYANDTPEWLRDFATRTPVSRYYDARWAPRDAALLARETKLPDDAPGETSNHGLGAAFPHKLEDADKVAFAIQETPFADEIVAQTVAVALGELELGRDEAPDFLAVSFNAHDYAAHGWGQESWEVLDLTLRLDALLGELFTTLDARIGKHQWAVVLTSDHGATPLVERAKSPEPRRIPYAAIVDAAEQAFEREAGAPGPYVATLVSNNLYLTPQATELAMDVKLRALEAALTAIRAVPGIGGALRTDLLEPDCVSDDEVVRAVCKAVVPGESGEVYVWAMRGSVITDAKDGTGHDAPNEDNRRVPILVMAPGVVPQQGVGTTLQVAPTLAALLGIPPPAAAKQPPLFGIQRR